MVTAEEFCVAYEICDSAQQVADLLGMQISAVYQRKKIYLEKGIELKGRDSRIKMIPVDPDAINAVLREVRSLKVQSRVKDHRAKAQELIAKFQRE